MRNGLKQGAALVIAAAVVAGGALLPSAASALQDRWLAAQTDTREIAQPQATEQPSSILTTLAILSDGNEGVLLRQGKERTWEQALAAANDALQALTAHDLLPPVDGPDEKADARPVLIVSELGGFASAVVWQISWITKEDWNCTMQIDDATGMLVGVQIYNLPIGSTAPVSDPANPPQTIERRWLDFCREYYDEDGFTLIEDDYGFWGVEMLELQQGVQREIWLSISDISVDFNYPCRFYVGSMPY